MEDYFPVLIGKRTGQVCFSLKNRNFVLYILLFNYFLPLPVVKDLMKIPGI